MRSLRTKIATTVALFAIVLGLAASTAAAVALWQKDRSDTSDAAASLVFDVIDFDPANVERLPVSDREIAMVLDEEGNYKHADTGVSDDVIDAAFDSAVLDAIDTEFVSFDSAKVGSTEWSFAGLACPDEKVCSSVVTGVSSPSLQRYLLDRWYFLTAVALASGMCAYGCARWLVGRSLRPVEAMRKELASITASATRSTRRGASDPR